MKFPRAALLGLLASASLSDAAFRRSAFGFFSRPSSSSSSFSSSSSSSSSSSNAAAAGNTRKVAIAVASPGAVAPERRSSWALPATPQVRTDLVASDGDGDGDEDEDDDGGIAGGNAEAVAAAKEEWTALTEEVEGAMEVAAAASKADDAGESSRAQEGFAAAPEEQEADANEDQNEKWKELAESVEAAMTKFNGKGDAADEDWRALTADVEAAMSTFNGESVGPSDSMPEGYWDDFVALTDRASSLRALASTQQWGDNASAQTASSLLKSFLEPLRSASIEAIASKSDEEVLRDAAVNLGRFALGTAKASALALESLLVAATDAETRAIVAKSAGVGAGALREVASKTKFKKGGGAVDGGSSKSVPAAGGMMVPVRGSNDIAMQSALLALESTLVGTTAIVKSALNKESSAKAADAATDAIKALVSGTTELAVLGTKKIRGGKSLALKGATVEIEEEQGAVTGESDAELSDRAAEEETEEAAAAAAAAPLTVESV
eukprot:CAMPEP_0113538492 /NCGR_PEP_ID=MMETSP0015_2-20120614/7392_1 /TAXON_ID=2838 /ORGANISM="Odontella" /LENGTH=495 /DNA_ID=CAMNT_0000438065 /DNA_START=218 /DNA_END=1702 /DNA_ORIENTATION=- /assembly_acc=CAM_ASM_000160